MLKLLWAWATVSFSTHPECLKAPFTSIWSFETFTSSEFSQLMLQQLRQVYTKSCNYKTANNLDYVQTSRCVHIHYVQTRHCVHIVYVQTSHSVHIHYVQTRPTFRKRRIVWSWFRKLFLNQESDVVNDLPENFYIVCNMMASSLWYDDGHILK